MEYGTSCHPHHPPKVPRSGLCVVARHELPDRQLQLLEHVVHLDLFHVPVTDFSVGHDLARPGIAVDDQLALPHLNEGLVLFATDRFEEAVASLERAVAADPENAFAHYTLGVLYMDYVADSEKALLHLEAYQELDGRDSRVDAWVRKLMGG